MGTLLRQDHLRTVALKVRARALVGVVVVVGILIAACEPDVQVPDPVSNCRVVKNVVFHVNAMQFDHYHPNRCPEMLPGNDPTWGFLEYYQGTESAPVSSVAAGAIVLVAFENNAAENVGSTDGTMVQWGNTVRADLQGVFERASVELCVGCRGDDIAYNMVMATDNQVASAEVEMPYYKKFAITVDGPTWCPPPSSGPCQPGPGGTFSVSAQLSDAFNGPYRYEWFRNGVSMGPPTLNASTFTDEAGAAGTYQRYEVAVTDTVRGRVFSNPRDVWIPYPEGGGGGCEPWMIECD